MTDPKATNRELCGCAGNERGYGFFNPDTGMEWSVDHPIKSGQVPDAEFIQPIRFSTFRRQHMGAGE